MLEAFEVFEHWFAHGQNWRNLVHDHSKKTEHYTKKLILILQVSQSQNLSGILDNQDIKHNYENHLCDKNILFF